MFPLVFYGNPGPAGNPPFPAPGPCSILISIPRDAHPPRVQPRHRDLVWPAGREPPPAGIAPPSLGPPRLRLDRARRRPRRRRPPRRDLHRLPAPARRGLPIPQRRLAPLAADRP